MGGTTHDTTPSTVGGALILVSQWKIFPTECCLSIFSLLPFAALMCSSLVSKEWQTLANTPSLWHQLCLVYWPSLRILNKDAVQKLSWKLLFSQRQISQTLGAYNMKRWAGTLSKSTESQKIRECISNILTHAKYMKDARFSIDKIALYARIMEHLNQDDWSDCLDIKVVGFFVQGATYTYVKKHSMVDVLSRNRNSSELIGRLLGLNGSCVEFYFKSIDYGFDIASEAEIPSLSFSCRHVNMASVTSFDYANDPRNKLILLEFAKDHSIEKYPSKKTIRQLKEMLGLPKNGNEVLWMWIVVVHLFIPPWLHAINTTEEHNFLKAVINGFKKKLHTLIPDGKIK